MRVSDRNRRLRFLSRRRALGLGAAAVASTVLPGPPAQARVPSPFTPFTPLTNATGADAIKPTIRPRADWAGDLGVKGPILPEEDVRFLLVHHTASTNDYRADQVVSQIRGFYDFHTGPEKLWPDVAYNFFVDRYGGIWEARQGSLDGPVRGDATGGSQGFGLLCSLIGNNLEAPMTAEQQESLVKLLAWLGESYGIDTSPGATVSFVSRGSSRWDEGVEVTAATISGHRDMSTTTCPGDFVYDLLPETIPSQVSLVRAGIAEQEPSTATTNTTTTTEATTTEATTSTSSADSTPTSTNDASTGSAEAAADVGATVDDGDTSDRSVPLIIAGAIAGVVAAVGGAANWIRGRTTSDT